MRGSQAAQFYEARQSEAMRLIEGYNELDDHVEAAIDAARTEIQAARLQLAQAYLTELTDEALKRLPDLTGFLGFERRNPLTAMAHERAVLAATVKRIGADERYRQRVELVGPEGSLTAKLKQAYEMLKPWLDECKTYEDHEGFLELIEVKYDTPEFAEKWWHASYWKHWAWGDRICEALGVGDFGDDILPVYRRAAEQRDFYQAEYDVLWTKSSVIHDLTKSHDNALARIPTLPALYLEQAQQYFAEYLEQSELGLLEQWLSEHSALDRPIIVGLRRLAGLKAKIELLEELRTEGLTRAVSDLRQRASKFARKTQKYLRNKHYYREIPDRELDHGFAQKYPKYAERPAKLRSLVDRIWDYDDYSTFDLSNDPALWWFAMTGKKPPQQWPRTRRWYDRRPSFQIQRDAWGDDGDDIADGGTGARDDDDESAIVAVAVATAAGARDLDEVGYLS